MKKIMAVVVSYNCDSVVTDNIKSLRKNVDYLMVIDNNSNRTSKEILNTVRKEVDEFIFNDVNNGISFALNQGLNVASMLGFDYFLTMDQDTVLDGNAIVEMSKILDENDDIVSVGPDYIESTKNSAVSYTDVQYLITSGNLLRTDQLKKIGGYDDKLFIDSVDFDVSLRLIQSEGRLVKVKGLNMNHKIGEYETGIFGIKVLTHSPLRHYYIARNHWYLRKKYFRDFPKFIIKKEIMLWLYILKMVLFQKSRLEKVKMFKRGIDDARRNKYGKYETD